MHRFLLLSSLLASLLVVTGCTPPIDPDLDSDKDGLPDVEEIELGTDPMVADTDGDGFNDQREVTDRADPLNPYIWPYDQGEWPDFMHLANEAGVTDADTYAWNAPMPAVRGVDQYLNSGINLHRFYGNVILLDLSAGWCGPCRAMAEDAQEFWEEYREQGFIIIHLMIDDNSQDGITAEGFQTEWADDYDLTFPVLRERADITSGGLFNAGMYGGGIPFSLFIDREMNAVTGESGVGAGGIWEMSDIVEELLAQ